MGKAASSHVTSSNQWVCIMTYALRFAEVQINDKARL